MDVVCERCQTEYEFDETLLAPSGTAVRCGQCNHAFRVFPPSQVAGNWTVKRDDGLYVTVRSLSDLRSRIRGGELAENDAISRDGSPWKLLGDIAELRSTFESARTARKPRPTGPKPRPDVAPTIPRARVATQKDGWAALGASGPSAASAPAPAAPTSPGPVASRDAVTQEANVATAPAQPIAPSKTVPRRPQALVMGDVRSATADAASRAPSPAPAVVAPQTPRPMAAIAGTPTAGRGAPGRPRLIVLALDEDELPPQRTQSRLGWFTALVAFSALAGVFLWFRARTANLESERHVITAQTSASTTVDTYDVYRDAARTLGEQHAQNPDDVEPIVALALCEARWAQALSDEASFETDEGRARSLRGLAAQHADEALRFGDRASAMSTSRPALTAAADAHRVHGDAAGATALLARALATGGDDSSETHRVAAELAADGDRDSARRELAHALEMAPADARLVIVNARLLLAAGELDGARTALERLRGASPAHPGVRYLDAGILARMPVDAGVPRGNRR